MDRNKETEKQSRKDEGDQVLVPFVERRGHAREIL